MARTLPLEVTDMVLEWVYRDSQSLLVEGVDYKTLAAGALVCTSWTSTSQKLLFSRIPLVSSTSFTTLLDAITNRPVLGTHVRSISVNLGIPVRAWDAVAKVPFIALLSRCPNVLKLATEFRLKLNADDIRDLRALQLKLEVLDWQGYGYANDLYAFLDLWPTIRFLRIDYIADDPPETRPPFALHGLQLSEPLEPNIMTWLLPPRPGPFLRILETELQPYVAFDEELEAFAAHASSVTSFTASDIPAQNILDLLSGLEEFIVTELPDEPFTLPQSVQHVGYLETADLEDDEMMQGMRDPALYAEARQVMQHFLEMLSSLPKLRCVSWTRTMIPPVRAALEEKCRQLGVEFIVYREAGAFPRPRYVDWLREIPIPLPDTDMASLMLTPRAFLD